MVDVDEVVEGQLVVEVHLVHKLIVLAALGVFLVDVDAAVVDVDAVVVAARSGLNTAQSEDSGNDPDGNQLAA